MYKTQHCYVQEDIKQVSLLNNKRWVAFFSHTGNEINNLSKKLGRYPDRVVTNRSPDAEMNQELLSSTDIVYTRDRPDVEDYSRVLRDDECVVTLHGWMRIVPKTICKEYDIYNLHPGLITKYPELKGADPQARVANHADESVYKHVGCVIHRVTPGVDEGQVLASASTANVYSGAPALIKRLHVMALDLWVEFITHENI